MVVVELSRARDDSFRILLISANNAKMAKFKARGALGPTFTPARPKWRRRISAKKLRQLNIKRPVKQRLYTVVVTRRR